MFVISKCNTNDSTIVFKVFLMLMTVITVLFLVSFIYYLIIKDSYCGDTKKIHLTFSQFKKFYLASQKNWSLGKDYPTFRGEPEPVSISLLDPLSFAPRYSIVFNYLDTFRYMLFQKKESKRRKKLKTSEDVEKFLKSVSKNIEEEAEKTEDLLKKQIRSYEEILENMKER